MALKPERGVGMGVRVGAMALVLAGACAASAGVWADPLAPAAIAELAPGFGGEKAVTQPSRDAVMGFSFPVEVSEVLVTGGQAVKAGDLLVRARDEEVVQALELQKIAAESDLDVQRAAAAVELAQIQFDSASDARSREGLSKFEFDQAKNTLTTRKIELGIAKIQHEQRQIGVLQKQAELERYRLVAPFDGTVDVVVRQVGQAVNDSEPVVRVVNIDPLWIDVPTPVGETMTLGLEPGSPAWVLLEIPGEPRVWPGKVVEVAAVADSASGTRRVRVELANPSRWPAGVTCWVRFVEPTGEWAGRVQKDGAGLAAADGVAADGAATDIDGAVASGGGMAGAAR